VEVGCLNLKSFARFLVFHASRETLLSLLH